jgi:hypothetical protein
MKAPAVDRAIARLTKLLWAIALVGLPITSFPYIPGPLGSAQIKPFSMLPLAILLPLLLWRQVRQKRLELPANLRPLLVFLLFAAASGAIALLYAPEPLRGAGLAGRLLRGWVSLSVGLAFFFATFWMNRNRPALHFTLRWLYVGLVLTLLWSLVQALAIHTELVNTSWVNALQRLVSEHPLFDRRVSGLAYEPSWLADQLVGLYLPWLFAAVLTRSALTRWRWLEPLLLLLSLGVLLLTYSRGGLAMALVCAGLVTVLAGRGALGRAWGWYRQPFAHKRTRRSGLPQPAAIAVRLGLALGALLVLAAAGRFLASYDYITKLWEPSENEERNLVEYVIDISAGPRLAYAVAGYQVFEAAPLTGVGLGGSGLYLFAHFPDWSYTIQPGFGHHPQYQEFACTPAGRNRLARVLVLQRILPLPFGLCAPTVGSKRWVLSFCGCGRVICLAGNPAAQLYPGFIYLPANVGTIWHLGWDASFPSHALERST